MDVLVALSLFIFVTSEVYGDVSPIPTHTTGQVGSDVTLMCGYSGPQIFHWREYITNVLGQGIFTTPPDNQPENTMLYGIEGQYNLIVKDAALSSGGSYGCQEMSMESPVIADLMILEPPDILVPQMVEGVTTRVSCLGYYGGPEAPSDLHVPQIRILMDGILQNHPSEHIPAKPGPGTEYIPGELSMSFNHTAAVEDNGKNLTCEIYTTDPSYTVSSSILLNVEYPVRDMTLHPVQTTYYVGDDINCTADGNPTPDITWRPISSNGPSVINDNVLPITENMAGANEWKCQATNSAMNSEFVEEFIEFEVDVSKNPNAAVTPYSSIQLVMLIGLTLLHRLV